MLLSSFQKDSLSSPLKGNPQTIPNPPCTHFPSHSSWWFVFRFGDFPVHPSQMVHAIAVPLGCPLDHLFIAGAVHCARNSLISRCNNRMKKQVSESVTAKSPELAACQAGTPLRKAMEEEEPKQSTKKFPVSSRKRNTHLQWFSPQVMIIN